MSALNISGLPTSAGWIGENEPKRKGCALGYVDISDPVHTFLCFFMILL